MKNFLIFIAAVLLLGAGYFTYQNYISDDDLSSWSFIPDNAIIVYESSNTIKAIEDAQSTQVWQNLSYIEGFRKIEERIDILDSIAENGNFRKFFAGAPLLTSLHVTSSKDFDLLFVIEIKNIAQQAFLSLAQTKYAAKGFQKRTREYEGFTITEISTVGQNAFTYIFYKNYFIGSFSSFLVEDAIRTVSDSEKNNFRQLTPELVKLTKLQQDQGNLYFNIEKFDSFAGTFTQLPVNFPFAKSSFLDLRITDQTINLTGFSFADKQKDFLNVFSTPGGNFDIAEIIPSNTAWLYHFTSAEPAKLGKALSDYNKKNDPEATKHKAALLKDADFDVDYTFNLIDEEICLVNLETKTGKSQDLLFILEINDMGEALRYFNALGDRYIVTTGDTLYQEQYGEYTIRKLPIKEFPYALLGEIGKGFEEAYYLQHRNHLIFSNNLQRLKQLTLSIENESTWTKSLRINRFLSMTNKEAGFSVYVNVPGFWEQFMNTLKPDWQEFFRTQQFTFRNLEFIAMQFSAVDDKFYTNVTVYQPTLPKRSIPERINTLRSIELAETIISKPYLTINHNNKQREIMVQDSAYNVYLIASDFSVLWDKSTDGPIIGGIKQLDYYKNGKLQYLFATQNQVHILDRNGDYLPEFPKRIKDAQPFTDIALIDYNNTKDYRISLTDAEGNFYLTDKDLKPLDGWAPKRFSKPLVQTPVHERIDGKDIIITLQNDGKLDLLNRRGQSYKGFPIEIKSDIIEKPYIQTRNSFSESRIIVLTKAGELIEINFKGELIKREQLYKPGANTDFSILGDVTGSAYLITRNTEGSFEVLEPIGTSLFQKSFLSKAPIYTQYYQLGGGTEFIIFIDSGGSYLYLYNKAGTLLTGRPLAADKPVAIMQYENEFQVYRVLDRRIELVSFSL